MSMTDIMKNIYTFINILSQVRTDVITCWDEKSLHNACNWALYCMKIEEQMRDKPCREDLDRHVRSMAVMVRPLWLGPLNLNMMKHAITLLHQRLFDNTLCPTFIRKYLENASSHLSKSQPQTMFDASHIIHVCNELIGETSTMSHNASEISTIMVNNNFYGGEEYLSSCNTQCRELIGRDSHLTSSSIAVKAAAVMERLVELKSVCASCENRYMRYLEKLTERFSNYTGGYELICEMLLTEVGNKYDHGTIELLKQFIVRLIVADFGKLLWQVDVSLLCRLADRDDGFLNHYLEHLSSWAENMEPLYGPTVQGEWYTWRYKEPGEKQSHLTYDNLVKHVGAILLHSNHLKTKLESLMNKQCNIISFSVWTDVQKTVSRHGSSIQL